MPNELTLLQAPRCLAEALKTSMAFQQGDVIALRDSDGLFQLIGIDDDHNRCWVRQWPLNPQGSPVFEVELQQVRKAAAPETRESTVAL